MELMMLLLLPLLLLYLLPTWVAFANRHRKLTTVFCLNLFTGWSVIGWFAALAFALWTPHHDKLQRILP